MEDNKLIIIVVDVGQRRSISKQ
nr:hypothetical protein [Dolosicoccus paucivorans]